MSRRPFPAFQPAVAPPEERGGITLCFAFRRRELLVTRDTRVPQVDVLDEAGLSSVRHQYLGTLEGQHCYAIELEHNAAPPPEMQFLDLRMLFGRLEEVHHAVAGRAVQIMEWDRTHQFCGACGGPTERSETERSRTCKRCNLVQFPRLSPAMIVAVERDDEILLARSPHFPPGILSVLAGFVEPGESAEEAVAREVKEETNIDVEDVRYFASQPWPFPNSLMLGFTARYRGGEIAVDGVEIEEAGWYRYDQMPTTFAGNISISQWLMNDFIERKGGGRD